MSRSDRDRQEPADDKALVETLLGFFETSGLGVVQLDAQRRSLDMNQTARRILEDGRISLDVSNRLFVHNRQDNADLQRILGHAMPPPGTHGVEGAATVGRPEGLPSLVMRVMPVGGSVRDTQSQSAAAVVFIVDPLRDAGIDPTLVRKALGLTRAETKVTALLANGKSVRAITKSLNCEESTVRWHIKRILGKLGLTRQAELVHWVRSLGVFR